MLNAHADALIDLAEVLALAGQNAQAELDRVLALYERKGQSRHGGAHAIGTGVCLRLTAVPDVLREPQRPTPASAEKVCAGLSERKTRPRRDHLKR
jgi:hypothetical protein